MLILKIILVISFVMIFLQDYKERLVHWVLFLIVALGCGLLHYLHVHWSSFLISIVVNLLFVIIILSAIYLYSKVKLKIPFSESLGLGDVLLFIGLAFAFSTVSFLIVFVFSLIFSLGLHVALKRKSTFKTVSLAGNMSLFFAVIYLGYWSGIINSVYTI